MNKKGDFCDKNWNREMKEIKTRDLIGEMKTGSHNRQPSSAIIHSYAPPARLHPYFVHSYAPLHTSCTPLFCTEPAPLFCNPLYPCCCTEPTPLYCYAPLPCCASCTLRPQSCASALLLATALFLPHL
ncbi:hypothetical protein SLEP1_g15315 [Rubroshorea leprosula]|uniref:Uncharacterized protein n=1 Tax=Rubroshorea leprosula TaxID=152421 RepID=A0AAV5IWD5_9ROSI|nr:hypothetical protein SLEP1_g15315 [Rubroshorea leprosula]